MRNTGTVHGWTSPPSHRGSRLIRLPTELAAASTTTDWFARGIAIVSLLLAVAAGVIAALTYRRDRAKLAARWSKRGDEFEVEIVNVGRHVAHLDDAYAVALRVGWFGKLLMKQGWWSCPGDASVLIPESGITEITRLTPDDSPVTVAMSKQNARASVATHHARDLVMCVETLSGTTHVYLGRATACCSQTPTILPAGTGHFELASASRTAVAVAAASHRWP